MWAQDELALAERIGQGAVQFDAVTAKATPAPATSEVRAWARSTGLAVPDRGRLRPDIWAAWQAAHPTT